MKNNDASQADEDTRMHVDLVRPRSLTAFTMYCQWKIEPIQGSLVRGNGYRKIEYARASVSDFAHNNASAGTCEILKVAEESGV